MSLRHEHKGTGGGGGSSDFDVVSTDESVGVTRTGNTFDLSVVKTTVSSEDGTVKVTRTGDNYDLSVQVVTEENDGLARAFDKKIHDHSFANTANMGDGATPSDAVETYLTSEDPQYVPEYGQIVGWEDETGKLRLSRMTTPSLRLPIKSRWIAGVYDDVHETVCILSSGDPSDNNINGDFCVAVRKMTTSWKVIGAQDNEKWNSLAYGNGIIVATTGNSSNEFRWSADGGYTWSHSSALAMDYWLRVRFNPSDNCFYFVATNRIVKSSDLQSFSTVFTAPSSSSIRDIAFMENSQFAYLYTKNGETYLRVGYNDVMHTSNFIMRDLYYADGYFTMCNDTFTWISKYYPNDPNLKLHDVASYYDIDDPDVVISSAGGDAITLFLCGDIDRPPYDTIIRKVVISNGHVQSTSEVTYGRTDYPSGVFASHAFLSVNDGEYCLFVFGGGHSDYSSAYQKNSSDWAKMLKLDLSEFPPITWEEIPVLNDKTDGLLCAKNGEFSECEVEKPYVTYKNGELNVNHSDRYTEYENYRLIEKTTGDDPLILWCIADLSSVVDNSTYVYEDEACTIVAGIITRHSYNPNNPNDVEVQIDGVSYTFDFQTSKIPVSLATTKALIDARTDKLGYWIGLTANLPPVGSREANKLYITTDY